MESVIGFLRTLLYHGLESIGKYYSHYEGIVTRVDDPENRNRIKVIIPNITQSTEHPRWVPTLGQFSGKNYGAHILPEVGDKVEIRFDFGDSRFPRWQFSGYLEEEKPHEFTEKSYGFKTPSGHKVLLSDLDNIIEITHADGSVIRMEKERILVNHSDKCSIILHDEYIKALYEEKSIEMFKDKITINGGKLYGIPKAEEVIKKLNALEKAHNKLIEDYKVHTHTSASPGSPTTPLVKPYLEQSLKESSIPDIENKEVVQ